MPFGAFPVAAWLRLPFVPSPLAPLHLGRRLRRLWRRCLGLQFHEHLFFWNNHLVFVLENLKNSLKLYSKQNNQSGYFDPNVDSALKFQTSLFHYYLFYFLRNCRIVGGVDNQKYSERHIY